MIESSRLSPALKRALDRSMPRAPEQAQTRPLGFEPIDQALGGGLAVGKLHEVFPASPLDGPSAMGFAVMLALCLTQGETTSLPIFWLREEAVQRRTNLHGPGLVDLGLDPGRLILGVLPDAKALLRASADALRCAALGVVVMELSGNSPLLDLTASRRLALSAEGSGVTPLLLRLQGARPAPSAAQTRWQIAAAPSAPLEADAPGHPALTLTLLRQRGGASGLDWTVEWDRDAGCFRPAALSGARLPLSGGGSLPADGGADDAGDAGWRIAS